MRASISLPKLRSFALLAAAGALLSACTDTSDTLVMPEEASLAQGGSNAAVQQVVSGQAHSCALTATGEAYCWGANFFGQLGTGSTGGISATPVAVTGDLRFEQLAAGGNHTCGLTKEGELYCWGQNTRGELGSFVGPFPEPIRVAEGFTFEQVSVGVFHVCALTEGGQAYCWGRNNAGQLGIGTFDNLPHTSPLPVSGGLTFEQVTAGTILSCGLTASGEAYCWGQNFAGDVFPSDSTAAPGIVAVPRRVGGDLTYTQLEVGSTYACGAATDGKTYCWGANLFGEFGTGPTPVFGPAPIESFGGRGGVVVTNPENTIAPHSCVIGQTGEMFCAGLQQDGSLGGSEGIVETCFASGAFLCNPVGTTVEGGIKFAQASAGLNFTCGLARDRDVYCWGTGGAGQLGNGGTANSPVPVQVTFGTTE